MIDQLFNLEAFVPAVVAGERILQLLLGRCHPPGLHLVEEQLRGQTLIRHYGAEINGQQDKELRYASLKHKCICRCAEVDKQRKTITQNDVSPNKGRKQRAAVPAERAVHSRSKSP